MKKLFIVLMFLLVIDGCAASKVFCPRERAYFLGPDGHIMVMEKDFFGEKEGHWITEDEFNLLIEKYKKGRGY